MKKIFPILLIVLLLLLVSCGQNAKQPGVAEIGKPAPDFTLFDLDGKTWKLSDLKGQVVFVNFWATWCPPCREEMPSMQTLYTSMPADRFKMLAILYNDDPGLADVFTKRVGTTFPILTDPKNEAGKAYGLTGVPETFIIDKQGVLREKFIGPAQWASPQIHQMLTNLINQ
ncbi:MAG: TlpA family protein disulfide reductase [Proteobacteria bacterium]|nr:TlpA family protein disulfide reductase [Pseudomonadota bacterium]MBU1709985.1 TlpA family protein disulfide reductase [Pseudomonadota bacterium]